MWRSRPVSGLRHASFDVTRFAIIGKDYHTGERSLAITQPENA
jgi:hypothetical protein